MEAEAAPVRKELNLTGEGNLLAKASQHDFGLTSLFM